METVKFYFKGRNSKKAAFTDLTEANLFIEKCKKFLCENQSSHLFNMDETYWRLLNGNLDVIGIKGAENRKVITGLTGWKRRFLSNITN